MEVAQRVGLDAHHRVEAVAVLRLEHAVVDDAGGVHDAAQRKLRVGRDRGQRGGERGTVGDVGGHHVDARAGAGELVGQGPGTGGGGAGARDEEQAPDAVRGDEVAGDHRADPAGAAGDQDRPVRIPPRALGVGAPAGPDQSRGQHPAAADGALRFIADDGEDLVEVGVRAARRVEVEQDDPSRMLGLHRAHEPPGRGGGQVADAVRRVGGDGSPGEDDHARPLVPGLVRTPLLDDREDTRGGVPGPRPGGVVGRRGGTERAVDAVDGPGGGPVAGLGRTAVVRHVPDADAEAVLAEQPPRAARGGAARRDGADGDPVQGEQRVAQRVAALVEATDLRGVDLAAGERVDRQDRAALLVHGDHARGGRGCRGVEVKMDRDAAGARGQQAQAADLAHRVRASGLLAGRESLDESVEDRGVNGVGGGVGLGGVGAGRKLQLREDVRVVVAPHPLQGPELGPVDETALGGPAVDGVRGEELRVLGRPREAGSGGERGARVLRRARDDAADGMAHPLAFASPVVHAGEDARLAGAVGLGFPDRDLDQERALGGKHDRPDEPQGVDDPAPGLVRTAHHQFDEHGFGDDDGARHHMVRQPRLRREGEPPGEDPPAACERQRGTEQRMAGGVETSSPHIAGARSADGGVEPVAGVVERIAREFELPGAR
ncbi:Uncharacterised protein [Mycobacterium tuberculosis]|nr:Uncharacterised protein [Mycobacterium tuberculosis]